jgi:hypothetical protein
MCASLRLTLLACALATGSARAADDAPIVFSAQAGENGVRVVVGEDDTVAFAAGELRGERVVKGAPYCADAELESVQPLADGNRIVRRQTTRLCRDGDGRTRQEVDKAGRRIVYLRDPVAQEGWVLDPERRTARRLGLHRALPGIEFDSSAWRDFEQRMRDWAKGFGERMRREGASTAAPPAPPMPPMPPTPAVIADEPHDVHMQVLRVDPPGGLPALPMVAPLPPGVAWRAQLGAPRGPGATTPLPARDLEGVRANGERTTWTIEAGTIGNEKPIVITREVWTSPDLMLTMLTRDADPRTGETTYRVKNLRRAEPDAASMRVPGDYAKR